MQAKDIPDEAFLAVVREFNEGRAPDKVLTWPGSDIPDYLVTGPRWAMVWDVAERLEAPEKVIRAKAAKLIRRGLLDGCACGCRGDFDVVVTRFDPVGEAVERIDAR